jgi:undecaprenyl-diphosphatase
MVLQALYPLDPAPALQRLLCCSALDPAMAMLSRAGEGWVLALLAVAIAWSANRDRSDATRCALRGLVVLAVTGLLVVVTKQLVHAPRPLLALGPERVRVLLEPLRQLSFPSGHSAASAALALWASRDRAVRWGRWPGIFAFLVGLSRVYVGAHWMTDVFAGWLLGIVTASAVLRAWPRPTRNPAATTEGTP